jgi:hypothetical protein
MKLKVLTLFAMCIYIAAPGEVKFHSNGTIIEGKIQEDEDTLTPIRFMHNSQAYFAFKRKRNYFCTIYQVDQTVFLDFGENEHSLVAHSDGNTVYIHCNAFTLDDESRKNKISIGNCFYINEHNQICVIFYNTDKDERASLFFQSSIDTSTFASTRFVIDPTALRVMNTSDNTDVRLYKLENFYVLFLRQHTTDCMLNIFIDQRDLAKVVATKTNIFSQLIDERDTSFQLVFRRDTDNYYYVEIQKFDGNFQYKGLKRGNCLHMNSGHLTVETMEKESMSNFVQTVKLSPNEPSTPLSFSVGATAHKDEQTGLLVDRIFLNFPSPRHSNTPSTPSPFADANASHTNVPSSNTNWPNTHNNSQTHSKSKFKSVMVYIQSSWIYSIFQNLFSCFSKK